MQNLLVMHYVYLFKLSNGNYYTGRTNDLRRRLREHETGNNLTTKRFLPIKLVNYLAFDTEYKAEVFEQYLKTGSGIAFRKRHLE